MTKCVVILCVLAPLSTACSIVDGLGFFADPGPFDETACTTDDPLCYGSDFQLVCDTYGGEIDDGDDTVVTQPCVEPAQVSRGPCADNWEALTTNARDGVRIVQGSWDPTPQNDNVVVRCFVGTLLVVTEDDETHLMLLEASTIEFSVDEQDSIIGEGARPGIVRDTRTVDDIRSSTDLPAVELSFCMPDPSGQSEPLAIAAIVQFEDETTTHPRCLDKEP
jgi:hypothetical protein